MGGPRCRGGAMRGGRCGAGKWDTGGDIRPFKGVPLKGKKGGGRLSSVPRGERKWGRASAGNHGGRRPAPA
jgi:hypothetical protein